MAKQRKVRCAVIGLGMGRHHAQNYSACPDSELYALCDIDEKRLKPLAEEMGVKKTYSSAEDLAADRKVDAVSVALPNFLHAPISIMMLEAGKHVMCEKPMATTVEEAEAMQAAARKSGRKFMMHFNTRFTPASLYIKSLVKKGLVGDVYHARTIWHRRQGIPGVGGWFTIKEKSGGGPLIDIGVHRIDLALWLMGHPRPVAVSGATFAKFGPKLPGDAGKVFSVEDFASGYVRFDNGATLSIETSWASFCERREDMSTIIFGDKGGAEHGNLGEGYEMGVKLIHTVKGQQKVEIFKTMPPPKENAQSHFVHCIQKNRTPMASAKHGVFVQKILNGLYESAETGREARM
ncbi:MAG: Gfo/Idh/MocA family oxidoreductase [Planctomycetota bacterium]|jgi:predicted dehydrogenase|nr:Gfo/Idh/MocA family oxidoreductase [Planctomycetota bacterium]